MSLFVPQTLFRVNFLISELKGIPKIATFFKCFIFYKSFWIHDHRKYFYGKIICFVFIKKNRTTNLTQLVEHFLVVSIHQLQTLLMLSLRHGRT